MPEETIIYTYNNQEQLIQKQNEKTINTPRNQITIPITTTNYTYDANGNIATKQVKITKGEIGGNENQNCGTFTTTYTYDYNNLLTQIEFPNNKTEIFHNCDCGTKRVYKKNVRGKVSQYFFDTINGIDQVLIVYNKYGRAKKIYTYGDTTDQPIEMRQYKENGYGRWHTIYYLYDGQGNVRQRTNSRGQVIATYNYLPFGEMMNKGEDTGEGENIGDGTPFGGLQNWGQNGMRNTITYQGREYDRDAGLYYYRARYQDPRLGRFLEVDPLLREVPTYTTENNLPSANGNSGCGCCGNTNQNNNLINNYSPSSNAIFTPAYIFVNNDPINYVDPTGLCCNGHYKSVCLKYQYNWQIWGYVGAGSCALALTAKPLSINLGSVVLNGILAWIERTGGNIPWIGPEMWASDVTALVVAFHECEEQSCTEWGIKCIKNSGNSEGGGLGGVNSGVYYYNPPLQE